jgi:urease accessory protein
MQRASSTAVAGTWSGPPLDRVALDYEGRHRRRITLRCASGREVLLDLPAVTHLRGGDAIRLDDGGFVEVCAAAEPLLELRAPSPGALVRLAWHLGNRHVAAELGDDCLRIRADHVLANLALQLGATVLEVQQPFDPEPGAYSAHTHALVRGT